MANVKLLSAPTKIKAGKRKKLPDHSISELQPLSLDWCFCPFQVGEKYRLLINHLTLCDFLRSCGWCPKEWHYRYKGLGMSGLSEMGGAWSSRRVSGVLSIKRSLGSLAQGSGLGASWTLPGEVSQACSTGRRPRVRPRAPWRECVSQLTWEHLWSPPVKSWTKWLGRVKSGPLLFVSSQIV